MFESIALRALIVTSTSPLSIAANISTASKPSAGDDVFEIVASRLFSARLCCGVCSVSASAETAAVDTAVVSDGAASVSA